MRGETRRQVLVSVAGAGLALVACAKAPPAHAGSPGTVGDADEDISPAEDLMREHGVLRRILLVYDEGIRRLDSHQPLPSDAIESAADLVRRFIERYHEKLEEELLFPRFERAGKLVDLVATLRRQHEVGRALTDAILRGSGARGLGDDAGRLGLADAMRAFARMYRPHAAREDTVLFPALREVVGEKELRALGARFEAEEHQQFGNAGFEGVVVQVGAIEQRLGIADLSAFTPAAP